MALDPKVFKAYDVRGIYPGELDEDADWDDPFVDRLLEQLSAALVLGVGRVEQRNQRPRVDDQRHASGA